MFYVVKEIYSDEAVKVAEKNNDLPSINCIILCKNLEQSLISSYKIEWNVKNEIKKGEQMFYCDRSQSANIIQFNNRLFM